MSRRGAKNSGETLGHSDKISRASVSPGEKSRNLRFDPSYQLSFQTINNFNNSTGIAYISIFINLFQSLIFPYSLKNEGNKV